MRERVGTAKCAPQEKTGGNGDGELQDTKLAASGYWIGFWDNIHALHDAQSVIDWVVIVLASVGTRLQLSPHATTAQQP